MRGLAADAGPVRGPVRSAGAGGGVRGRDECRVGAVAGLSRPVPSRPARASRARSAALVPPHAWRSREAAPLCSLVFVPPRAAAPPLPAAAGAMPPAYVMKRAAGLGSAGSSREP